MQEGARQPRFLVHQDVGETQAESLDDLPFSLEGTVLRHVVEPPWQEACLGDVSDRLVRLFGLNLP